MKRIEQAVLIVTFIAFSWLAMQAVHECGHVAGAWLTGATGVKAELHPLTLSRTDIADNPHPLIVVWCGPVLGSLLPLLGFFVARYCHLPGVYLFRFFTGFCLVANGAYIAFGHTYPLDGGVMIQHGTPLWMVFVFGALTAPFGLYLWHREGAHFGLGGAGGAVSRSATIVSVLLLLGIVILELAFN